MNKDNKQNDQMSSDICLNAAKEEYQYVIQRANKFENKTYILITLLGLYSSFVLSVFSDLSNIEYPISIEKLLLTIVCVSLFAIMCITYIYILFQLINNLKPIVLKRFDPNHLFEESLYNQERVVANMLLAKKYTECTNDSNLTLTKLYSKSEKINTALKILITVSIVLKGLWYFL